MEDNRWVKGAMAGILATVPMSISIVITHRLLPARQQYPVPPRLITERWLEGRRSEPALRAWTLFNHFGFGAVAGCLYTGLGLDKQKALITGPAFGVAVWAASYLGWVPALGLMPQATRQPAGRNTMMVGSHLVWGAALAGASLLLSRRRASSRSGMAKIDPDGKMEGGGAYRSRRSA